MKSVFYLIFLIAISSACSTQENDKSESTFENSESKYVSKIYSGTIGKYPITMELSIQGESLIAKYVYNKKCEIIELKGKLNDKNISLSGNKESFNGKLDTKLFSGVWTNGKKKFNFKLEEKEIPFFTIDFKTLQNKNCTSANENHKHISDSTQYWDTLCTSLDITFMSMHFENQVFEQKLKTFIEKEICKMGNMYEDKVQYKSINELLNSVNKIEDEFGYEHSISCNFIERFENILTFSISDYSYGFGAAHPNHFSVMYNIDLMTGNQIKLEDLIIKGTKEQLNRIAEKLFVKENGFENWDFERGKFELNDDFIIEKDGLLFTYDAYEIGPYAAGDPSVFIPFSKIKNLLKSDSVLKEFKF